MASVAGVASTASSTACARRSTDRAQIRRSSGNGVHHSASSEADASRSRRSVLPPQTPNRGHAQAVPTGHARARGPVSKEPRENVARRRRAWVGAGYRTCTAPSINQRPCFLRTFQIHLVSFLLWNPFLAVARADGLAARICSKVQARCLWMWERACGAAPALVAAARRQAPPAG